MSFLYVIAPINKYPCKLGISADPERRLKQLQTGFPGTLNLYYTEPVVAEHLKVLERLLHRDINHLREKGEWFKLTVNEAIAHVQYTIIRYADVPNLLEKVRHHLI